MARKTKETSADTAALQDKVSDITQRVVYLETEHRKAFEVVNALLKKVEYLKTDLSHAILQLNARITAVERDRHQHSIVSDCPVSPAKDCRECEDKIRNSERAVIASAFESLGNKDLASVIGCINDDAISILPNCKTYYTCRGKKCPDYMIKNCTLKTTGFHNYHHEKTPTPELVRCSLHKTCPAVTCMHKTLHAFALGCSEEAFRVDKPCGNYSPRSVECIKEKE
jgi:hypothetical protein